MIVAMRWLLISLGGLLSVAASGCHKGCESQPPGFQLNVTLAPAVDTSRVGCLRLTVDADRRAVDVKGKLESRRASVSVLDVVESGEFDTSVTVEACASCPGPVDLPDCTGLQALASGSFQGKGNACNVFELTLGASSDGGPPDASAPDR